jgi:septal ring factor EnvC (AmiA/AmiB activator)
LAQDKVNMDTSKTLGRIEANVDTILQTQQALFSVLKEHEKKISTLENALGTIQVKIAVASAAVGAVFAGVANWIWIKILNH